MDRALEREKYLKPVKHQQGELFLCDLGDVVLKDDLASMEHPIFSLSKTPDRNSRVYNHNRVELRVEPSSKGLATIWDKDVLIFVISQLIEAKNAGQKISPEIRFNAKDFLIFANRSTGGYDYDRLQDALERLDGTRLRTTIQTGGEESFKAFGLIEWAEIVRAKPSNRVIEWGIKLSDWLFRAIESNEVLTLHPDYFRLKSSLERRIYEIARKHCGSKQQFKIGLELLQKKCGSNSPLRTFRMQVRKIAATRTIPDYDVDVTDDMVTFFAAEGSKVVEHPIAQAKGSYPRPYEGMLKDGTFEKVIAMLRASNSMFDKNALFQQFASKVERDGWPEHLDGAFIGYVKRALAKEKQFDF